MQPYTPNTGLTVPGQQLGNLQDVLSQISGMAQQSGQDPTAAVENSFAMGQNAAQPQSFQNATNQLTQQAGIPALQNQQQNLGQVFQMWLADQNLSSKYASPQLLNANNPVYNSGLQGQAQPGVSASAYQGIQDPYLASPTAILNAVAGGGYQGATNPAQNTAAMTAVPSSAANISNTLSGLINTEQGLVNTQAGNYQTNYSNIMNALGSVLANQASTSFATAQPGTPQYNLRMTNSAEQNIKSGRMTLLNALEKYQGVLDPTTIFNLYTRYNHGTGKNKVGYGDPIETPELLQSYGINLPSSYVKQKQSEDTQNLAASNTLDTLQQMQDSFNKMNPIERMMPSQIASMLPGVFPNKAALDTQFYTQLESDLRKSAIGGRITQAEMQWIKNAVLPQPTDTESSYQLRVSKVKDSITKKLQNPDYLIGSPSSGTGSGGGSSSKSDPLGIL